MLQEISRNHLGIVQCRSPRTPLTNSFFKIPLLWPLRKRTFLLSLLLRHLLGVPQYHLVLFTSSIPHLPSPAGAGASAPAWLSCSALGWPGDLKTSGPAIPSPSPCSVYARSPSPPPQAKGSPAVLPPGGHFLWQKAKERRGPHHWTKGSRGLPNVDFTGTL